MSHVTFEQHAPGVPKGFLQFLRETSEPRRHWTDMLLTSNEINRMLGLSRFVCSLCCTFLTDALDQQHGFYFLLPNPNSFLCHARFSPAVYLSHRLLSFTPDTPSAANEPHAASVPNVAPERPTRSTSTHMTYRKFYAGSTKRKIVSFMLSG